MIKILDGYRLAPDVSFQCKALSIGRGAVIHNRVTFLGDSITIGDNVWIGQDCILDGTGGLTIGDNVTIGFGSYIHTHAGTRGFVRKAAPVSIGDCSWLMSRVSVNPGVKIGRDVLVYNTALVAGDVPDSSIAAGSPAKVIGKVPKGELMSSFLAKKGLK